MATVTVERPDVSTEEVVEALRRGLGPAFRVLPGRRMSWFPFGGPRPSDPDTIVVGTGSVRLVKAQVTVDREDGRTRLRISPGGLASDLLVNALGIARRVRRVLEAAPTLHSSDPPAP
jgi:hypothetical protein